MAALFALLMHNWVDFGLETPGIVLPASAVLGTLLGRARGADRRPTHAPRLSWQLPAFAIFGLAIGTVSLARPEADDFDNLMKRARDDHQRSALLVRAQETHPMDYFYPLTYSRLLPLRGADGGRSARLHVLNRALRLCPSCDAVHFEIARNLWALGLRRQSLLEWRAAVDFAPDHFRSAITELYRAGATPSELAAVASPDATRTIEVALFIGAARSPREGLTVLDQAGTTAASKSEILLARLALQMQGGLTADALETLKVARSMGIQDPRCFVFETKLLLATKGAAAADQALSELDLAAARYPTDVDIQRARLGVVSEYAKWSALGRSVEGLKLALYRSQGSATEAHIASARAQARLGRWQAAISDYRMALADEPKNAQLWLELGNAAATVGRNGTARDAYLEAARLTPNSPAVGAALKKLDEDRANTLDSEHGARPVNLAPDSE